MTESDIKPASPRTPVPLLPENVSLPRTTTDLSGFVIVRLAPELPTIDGDTLREVAEELKLTDLVRLLDDIDPASTRRLITSVSPDELLAMESRARDSLFPPLHSLTSYWRIDLRDTKTLGPGLIEKLLETPGVEHAYEELTATNPAVNTADDTHNPKQGYLDAGPDGIDARWCWAQTRFEGTGAGIGITVIEEEWLLSHEDIAGAHPQLIFNDNFAAAPGGTGEHGTAVLGEIVALDNNRGVIGIAPGATPVRLSSHYKAATVDLNGKRKPASNGHVADAVVAATKVMSPGDVLLLEVQRSELPTEADPADLQAIRLATAQEIIVVAAAGNGAKDLDKENIGAVDSGAILVGAATAGAPHQRLELFSNHGGRLNCYAWGERVTTSAARGARPKSSYTHYFGGTSSAAAIIAGAALLVQGMYTSTSPSHSRLSPTQMRALLSDANTGTPQGIAIQGRIGVMPNLRNMVTSLGLP